MNKDPHENNGSKPNDFALVRKSSSAVEKVAPGAKRILAGIISDAVIVSRKQVPRIVVVDDEGWFLEMVELLIRKRFKNVRLQMFQDSKQALEELFRADPDILITDDIMNENDELNGENLVRRLVVKGVSYPILVVSGWPETEKWVKAHSNHLPSISLLHKPFTIDQFNAELSKHFSAVENLVTVNVDALVQEGKRIQRGDGMTPENIQAFELFLRAANTGHSEAQLLVYECYLNGHGTGADLVKALEWFHKSAESGFPDAQCRLGDFYQGTHDFIEAVKWYRKAAQQGNASAQCSLGLCYCDGEGVSQDYGEALKWTRKAAEQGDAIAQKNLGVFYDNGNGVTKDHAEAFKWYQKAAEQGNTGAQYNLGKCYLHGEGVAQNEAGGIAWLEKALNGGLGLAGFALGFHFHHALLPNYSEAIKYYRKAAELGYDRGAQNLANVIERLNKSVETPVVRRSAELGSSEASYEMGMRCLQGVGTSQSATEALKWFRLAIAQGESAAAWCHMGFLLEAGQGIPANTSEAILCFRRASELGSEVAHSRLVELNALDQ